MGKNNRTIFEKLKIEEKKLNIFIPIDNESVKILADFNIFGLPFSIDGEKNFAETVTNGNIFCPSELFLFTINNRMFAYIVKDEITKEIKEFITKRILENPLNPDDVGIHELKYGKVFPSFIYNTKELIRDNTYNDRMKEIMTDFHNLLSLDMNKIYKESKLKYGGE